VKIAGEVLDPLSREKQQRGPGRYQRGTDWEVVLGVFFAVWPACVVSGGRFGCGGDVWSRNGWGQPVAAGGGGWCVNLLVER